MMDMIALREWLTFVVRWAHIATAMAWFGAAFYFRARALRLRREADLPAGADGADWQFHGGAYIRSIRYAKPPPGAPRDLDLFKRESYFTWMSGLGLLVLVYYFDVRLLMIDDSRALLSPALAIAISLASLLGGWLLYDLLCKRMIRLPGAGLDSLLLALLVAASWGYYQLFIGRAAMLHVGALLATIMVGNVFFVVIPNGKRAQAAALAGQERDATEAGRTAQRGRHTQFLHLPIIALMISVHTPLMFATSLAWLLPPLLLAIGLLLGPALEAWHRDRAIPVWPWLVSGLLVAAMVWIAAIGRPILPEVLPEATGASARRIDSPLFAEVVDIVETRCAMCHARDTYWPGLGHAGKHVVLETPAEIALAARQIHLQAGLSTAMPPGNVTLMTPDERVLITAWYGAARR